MTVIVPVASVAAAMGRTADHQRAMASQRHQQGQGFGSAPPAAPNRGGAWDLERAMGLQVTLILCSMRDTIHVLGMLYSCHARQHASIDARLINSLVSSSSITSPPVAHQPVQVLSQLNLASRRDLRAVTVVSIQATGGMGGGMGGGALPTAAFLHATKSLLREVLGGRGAAVANGRSSAELKAFFAQADTDKNGQLSVMLARLEHAYAN